jgi:hypothetical protein
LEELGMVCLEELDFEELDNLFLDELEELEECLVLLSAISLPEASLVVWLVS